MRMHNDCCSALDQHKQTICISTTKRGQPEPSWTPARPSMDRPSNPSRLPGAHLLTEAELSQFSKSMQGGHQKSTSFLPVIHRSSDTGSLLGISTARASSLAGEPHSPARSNLAVNIAKGRSFKSKEIKLLHDEDAPMRPLRLSLQGNVGIPALDGTGSKKTFLDPIKAAAMPRHRVSESNLPLFHTRERQRSHFAPHDSTCDGNAAGTSDRRAPDKLVPLRCTDSGTNQLGSSSDDALAMPLGRTSLSGWSHIRAELQLDKARSSNSGSFFETLIAAQKQATGNEVKLPSGSLSTSGNKRAGVADLAMQLGLLPAPPAQPLSPECSPKAACAASDKRPSAFAHLPALQSPKRTSMNGSLSSPKATKPSKSAGVHAMGSAGGADISELLHIQTIRTLTSNQASREALLMATTANRSGRPSSAGPDGMSASSSSPLTCNLHRVQQTGVSVCWVLKLDSLLPPGPITTEEVAMKTILPVTSTFCVKLADLLSNQAIGVPRYYVIHAWAADFHGLAYALKRHCTDHQLDVKTTFVWLDVFCCNLLSKSVTQRDLAAMADVMTGCKQVLLVVDPCALSLGRHWCIHEAYMGVQASRNVKGVEKLRALLYTTELNALEDAWPMLAAGYLHCTKDSDQKLLMDDLQIDGCTLPQMATVVCQALLNSASGQMSAAKLQSTSSSRKLIMCASKLAMLNAASKNDWEAEKALRLALSQDKDNRLMNPAEEHSLIAHLASVMLKRGFLEEAFRLACQAQSHFELLLPTLDPYSTPANLAAVTETAHPLVAYAGYGPGGVSTRDPVQAASKALAGVLLTKARVYIKQRKYPEAENVLHALVHTSASSSDDMDADSPRVSPQSVSVKTSEYIQNMGDWILGDRCMLEALQLLAQLCIKLGRTREAETWYRKGIEDAQANGGSPLFIAELQLLLSRLMLRVLSSQAPTCSESGALALELPADADGGDRPWDAYTARLADALQLATAAFKVRTEILGKDCASALEALATMCAIRAAQGEYEQAWALVEHIISMCEKLPGDSHTISRAAREVATTLRDHYIQQGRAFRRSADDHRAEDMFRNALNLDGLVWSDGKEDLIRKELQECVRKQNHTKM